MLLGWPYWSIPVKVSYSPTPPSLPLSAIENTPPTYFMCLHFCRVGLTESSDLLLQYEDQRSLVLTLSIHIQNYHEAG